ncbi:3-isopropylmalate dehydrogenase [Haloimpatiens sp. FM7330]|uniref:3-isopropylmalate dehydrogenase n=1 Tax=Haloimpatiens sp. FM7330 TaxID=3298610 RepID=UPI003630939F
MKEFKIAVIPGDGIGVEVTEQALKVLEKVCKKYDTKLNFTELKAGGCAIDDCGNPLPVETLEKCKKSDAVFLGAVGGPKWDDLPGKQRPEQALLGLRGGLGLYANLRPTKVFDELKSASPLKDSIIDKGVDILVVRELTGGIYFGEKGRKEVDGIYAAYDTELYTVDEIKRIAHCGFKAAMKRRKKLTSVDKANILESSRLWREVVEEVAKEYPEVEVNHLYVDNASMQLVRNPSQFDIILTSNMFGDILSDEASMISGSIGMLASASLREDNFGMYEPVHGSAPDIAGMNLANPLAQILSAAMMLEYSLGMSEAARDIENAVDVVLKEGYRTGDIYSEGAKKIGTKEMGELILSNI